jgi:hypothetical protein
MLSEIVKEKTSADHLLYVSLKYTKTCDVILNLIERWRSMIEMSFDAVLEKAFDNGKIPAMPASPKERILFIKKNFAKNQQIQEALKLYIFFRKIPDLPKTREGEFRKNVALKIKQGNELEIINLEKLTLYSEVLERFISEVKQILR